MAKQVVDRETGEVLEEPDFVKVYIKDLCKIKNLKTGQTNIFRFMLSNMNWENVVSYGPTSKKKFLQEHGIKNQTFNNYVSDLIRVGLIQRVGRGEFMVNPKYAVKVDWAKAQSIRWTSEYTMEGKREVVEVIQGDDVLVRSSSYEPFDDDFAEPAPPPPKPKAKAKKAATKPARKPYEWPKPEGIDQETWDDWLMIRKTKRQAVTQRAIDMINKQASDYGISFQEAIVICVERGWGGFKAEYMDSKVVGFGGRGGVKTMEDFKREGEAQCKRIIDSGLLDDIFERDAREEREAREKAGL